MLLSLYPLILILLSLSLYPLILILLSLSSYPYPLIPILSLVFPYFLHFWPWPDSNKPSAVGGVGRCPTRFLSQILLRHTKNLRFFDNFFEEAFIFMLFYGPFCMHASDYIFFRGTFCPKIAECMHICMVCSFPLIFSPIFLYFSFTFSLAR